MIEKKADPSIERQQIKISMKGMSDKVQKDYVNSVGINPVVYYNGLHIQQDDVKTLNLDSTGFIPTFSMTFKDSSKLLHEKGFPLDDSNVSIFINPRIDGLEPIALQFKITEFEVANKNSGDNMFNMEGVLDVDYLYVQKGFAIKKKTSYEALKGIAVEAKLGFASNINSTNDSMTWINPGDEGSSFIKEIVDNAYSSDSAFLWAFVDLYYYLNYIDIEVAIEEDIASQQTIVNSPITVEPGNEEKTAQGPLILTNDISMKDHNTFFESFEILNQSTKNSLRHGYKKRIYYYDRSGNWDKKAGSFNIFDIDSISTPGAENRSLILKGKPEDMAFYKSNIKNEYIGKLDKDNMYVDYPYASTQNEQNVIDLQKVVVEMTLPTPNFHLYRYQKVQLVFSNQSTGPTTSQINQRLSGHWLITGISYKFSQKSGNKQIVTLVKRELNDVGDIAK